MHILVTNDDGVTAPGLLAIAKALRTIADVHVTVLAPDKNWSASGHVKTMNRPMRVIPTQLADRSTALACDGAPSDCVALALMGIVEEPIDFVVSGINPNANVGLDVTYSGTVTAAMEASINGRPGFAVSLDAPEYHEGPLDFEGAAKAAVEVILELFGRYEGELPPPIWNINLPYLPDGSYKGVQFVRQGTRIYHDVVEKRVDPRGKPYYWIGGLAPTGIEEPGTDYGAIKAGYISITPLVMDMTDVIRLARFQSLPFKSKAQTSV
ncbi:MAG: 5'/3'-nucleotidase SurE [Anaerolineaceae bacterium]